STWTRTIPAPRGAPSQGSGGEPAGSASGTVLRSLRQHAHADDRRRQTEASRETDPFGGAQARRTLATAYAMLEQPLGDQSWSIGNASAWLTAPQRLPSSTRKRCTLSAADSSGYPPTSTGLWNDAPSRRCSKELAPISFRSLTGKLFLPASSDPRR